MTEDVSAARDVVHEALPARWAVAEPSFDPGALRADGYRGAWSVTARGPHPGRGKAPQTVQGIGPDPEAALWALDGLLRGVPQPDGSRMDELRRPLRLAYIAGAEEWAMEILGRPMRPDELHHVALRYPGR